MKGQHFLAGGMVVALAATLIAAPVGFANQHEGNKDGMKRHCDKDEGQCKGGKHGKGMKQGHEKFMKELGLSEDQQAKIKASREAFKESNKGKHEAMKARHERLKALKESGATKDSAEVQALKAELKADKEAMFKQHEAQWQAVLTPEQFAKFQTMKAEKKAKWESKKQDRKQKKEALPTSN